MSNEPLLSAYITHRVRLVQYANRILGDPGRAEDVVQEAYFRVRNAASEHLVEEPVRYVYRIVRNLALDGQRRQSLEARHVGSDDGGRAERMAASRPSPEQEAIARQQLANVLAAMQELPERTRVALEMHRFGGFRLKDIAAHLGISVSMAQVLVVEGVRHCQRRM